MDEEMAPITRKASSAALDFDELLRQAQTKIRKKPVAKPAAGTLHSLPH